jgi:hypothetical protein
MSNELEPYEAPTIEDIPLIAQEQVLVSCKTNGGGNTSGTGLTCDLDQTTCQSQGGS